MRVSRLAADAGRTAFAALVERARQAERAGDWEAARRSYEDALQELATLPTAERGARAAEVFRWIGTLFRNRGELEVAVELYETSLAVAEAAGADHAIASALNCLAIIAQFRGNVDEAERLYDRAGRLAAAAGDERLAAMIDQNAGTLANTKGDYAAALGAYRSALLRFRALRDEQAAAWALNNLGMVHVDLCDFAEAGRCLDEAFDLADRQRDTHLLGTIELSRAELHLQNRDFNEARESCERAFEIFTRIDSRRGVGEAHKFYGILYHRMSRSGLAVNHLTQAIRLAEECEDRLLEAEALNEVAIVHLATGENRAALEALNRAHRRFAELRARAELLGIDARLDRLEATYLEVTRAWGESIESKDDYTAGHCQRVADYTTRLAAKLGFQGRELTWLRMAAFLHDVGKTVVPVEVLNKPGKLTDEEWALMKAHTTEGDEIVSGLNFPWDIRPVVRNHHERWDGSGYPDGLAGEEIPLTARILCVADVFDALTTARSYRPALPYDQALRIMDREAGVVLDPNIYPVFRQLVIEELRQAGGQEQERANAA